MPLHVLDPFGVTGIASSAFNPLDRLDPAGLDLADDAMTLADALVYDAPGEAGEAHWNEEAKALIADMQAQGGLIGRAANRHLGKSDREAAGVLSAAQRHTHFLDSPRMGQVLGRSDFTFADVKARPTTVYLVLPPDRLAT